MVTYLTDCMLANICTQYIFIHKKLLKQYLIYISYDSVSAGQRFTYPKRIHIKHNIHISMLHGTLDQFLLGKFNLKETTITLILCAILYALLLLLHGGGPYPTHPLSWLVRADRPHNRSSLSQQQPVKIVVSSEFYGRSAIASQLWGWER